MIMAGPDIPEGQEIDTPCQLLDVFPTILQATGVEPRDEDHDLPGHSLIDLANGEKPDRVILSQQHSAGAKSAVFMIRKKDYKYVRYLENYPEQLYDLSQDPLELNDLAQQDSYQQVLLECRQALAGERPA